MQPEYENKNKMYIKAAASLILILILFAMSSCSQIKAIVSNNDGGTQTTETTNGYVNIDTNKVLVIRKLDSSSGQRTLTKRSWGLDGTHFEAEEEYLAERPTMASDLMNGVTITFTL